MKKILAIIMLLILMGVGYYNLDNFTTLDRKEVKEKINAPQLKTNQAKKDNQALLQGDLYHMIGENKNTVKSEYGDPERKDKTPYGYVWWVYTDNETNLFMFGIENDVVETIFATGDEVSSMPFGIGDDYKEINDKFSFDSEVSYQDGLSFYTFKLNENDIKTNPLIKLADNLFLVSYFDTFTNTLSSIRIMTGDLLIKQRFFEMEYRGTLPEDESLTEEEWEEIEEGMEKQIFDITNIYRNRFDVDLLKYDEEVANVAYLHSEDMYKNNFFSHDSQDGRSLKERLEEQEVYYLSAGENIAAQHTDSPAAMEGWLNSEGHRDAMLYEDYNYIGVGVHRLYYTQNFLLKP